MLYLVYVLTFLAGVLFYALSPRDDQTDLDAYRAEGFIVSFLAQHQAAKDYMTQWLGFNLPTDGTSVFNLTKSTTVGSDKYFEMEYFLPHMVDSEISPSQDNSDPENLAYQNISQNNEAAYQTTVICTQDGSDDPVACNSANVQPYLVTYNGAKQRPSWWPKVASNRQRRYMSWANALNRRTGGAYNCGTLRAVGSQWCVDNGQTVKLAKSNECAQKVPTPVARALGCINDDGLLIGDCQDTLFCISRVKQGPERYYVQGLTAFYDGINNNKTGAEATRTEDDTTTWKDLVRPGSAYEANISGGNVTFSDSIMASQSGVTFPDFHIVDGSARLFRPFTLTVLLKGSGGVNDMNITFLKLNKLKFRLVKGGADTNAKVCIDPGFTGISESCNDIEINANDKIISLTVIGKPDALRVYINAGSDPVISLPRSSGDENWEKYKAETGETPEPTMASFHDLKIQSETNTAYIYGVRYYQNNALSVNRERTKDGYFPSGLERNFKMDAKRYGIGSSPTYTPTF